MARTCSQCKRNVGDKGDFIRKLCGHCVKVIKTATLEKLKRREQFFVEELGNKIIEIQKHKLTVVDIVYPEDFENLLEFYKYERFAKEWENELHRLYTIADKLCTELCTIRQRIIGL